MRRGTILFFSLLILSCISFVPLLHAEQNAYLEKIIKEKATSLGEDKAREIANRTFSSVMGQVTQKYNYTNAYTEGLRKIFEEDKIKETLDNFETAQGLWKDAAEGNWVGVSYTGAKEALKKLFPPTDYLFTFAEGYVKIMTEISQSVTNNNLDFIRGVYAEKVLKGKKITSDRVTAAQAEIVLNFLEDEEMLQCVSAYSNQNCTTALDKQYCGCVEYGLAQYVKWDSGWIIKFNMPYNKLRQALTEFVLSDAKIRQALKAHVKMVEYEEEFAKTKKRLEKMEAYLEKKVAESIKQEEERMARPEPTVIKPSGNVDVWKPENRERVEKLKKQIEDLRRAYGERTRPLNDQRSQLHAPSPGDLIELTLEEPTILEEEVDKNEELAEKFAMKRDSAREGLRYLELKRQAGQLHREHAAAEAALTKEATLLQGMPYTDLNGARQAAYPEQDAKYARDVAAIRKAITFYEKMAEAYKVAAEKGKKAAEEVYEEVYKPNIETYEEDQQAYSEAEQEVNLFESENLVSPSQILEEIASADSGDAQEALVEKIAERQTRHRELLDRRAAAAEKYRESSEKMRPAFDSVNAEKARSVFISRLNTGPGSVPRTYNTGEGIVDLSSHVKKFSEASRLLETEGPLLEEKINAHVANLEKELFLLEKSAFDEMMNHFSLLRNTRIALMRKAESAADLADLVKAFGFRPTLDKVVSASARQVISRLDNLGEDDISRMRRDYMRKFNGPVYTDQPRFGSVTNIYSNTVELQPDDVEDGELPFAMNVRGEGIVGAHLVLTANGQTVDVEREIDLRSGKGSFSARIPVEGYPRVQVEYALYYGERGKKGGEVLFLVPFSTENFTEVEGLYRQFQAAYCNRDVFGVIRLISEDWTAFDGSDIDELEEVLENSFDVFDDVEYRIRGLKLRKRPDGTNEASYSIDLTGYIRDQDIKHTESSRITEIVGKVEGRWKILKTLSGQFWRR